MKKRSLPKDAQPVKPYEATMEKYNSENITAFVEQCKVWDKEEVKEDFYMDEGEHVCQRVFTKFFDNSETHCIEVTSWYVNEKVIYCSSVLKRSDGWQLGREQNKWGSDKLNQILQFMDNRRHIELVLPILEAIFSEGYTYPTELYDPDISVCIENEVSFGDLEDIKNMNSFTTRRQFHPGVYKCAVLAPEIECDPLVIYHHETVDPKKILHQIILMMDDYERYHQTVKNSINRYDWGKSACYGEDSDEDEVFINRYSEDVDEEKEIPDKDIEEHQSRKKERNEDPAVNIQEHQARKEKNEEPPFSIDKEDVMVFFADSKKSKNVEDAVKSGHVIASGVIPDLYEVLDEDEKCMALTISMSQYNMTDCYNAKLFEDTTNQLCFALVINCILGDLECGIPEKVKALFPDVKFTSVKKTGLMFDMAEFLND